MFTKSKTILSAVTLAALVAASFSSVAYANGRGEGMGPMFDFTQMDGNGDGKVTKDEITAYHSAKVAAMDTDKDGTLSEAEMTAAQEQRKAERQTRKISRMMQRMDANNDGVVSLAEMEEPKGNSDRMFDRMDTDGDGAISKAEADAAMEKMSNRKNKRKDK